MVPNLIIYTLPNNTLMRAEIRESIAVVLAIGSDAAASIWSIVMMALKAHFYASSMKKYLITHANKRADT
jgi:Trk K+ transport system NAD-binding subunit